MEPLKPSAREALLKRNPDVTARDIEEYERLQAERFLMDPDVRPSPAQAAQLRQREERLTELHRKLYGTGREHRRGMGR